ncbi:hypothetical protein, partial [uncultured Duncaniella sp.]|uniref:hypothetical protein n=1 Tax=uncultured Duncaniella sp. TaxID=2768039 RepID=UPI00321FD90F
RSTLFPYTTLFRSRPKVTVEYAPSQKSSLVEDVIEATVGAIGNLFTLGPGFAPEEQAFQNAIKKEEAKRKRKSRKI